MQDTSFITSAQHPLIKHLLKLRTCKKYRLSSNELFVEGEKVLADLAKTHIFSKLIVAEDMSIPAYFRYKEKHIISRQNFNKISGVSAPSCIAATMPMVPMSEFGPHDNLLILDNLQDPGNIGSLVRSALAFGCDGIFLLEEGVDYFNDKIIRSSRGALFSLPFQTGSEKDLLTMIEKNKAQLLIADTAGTSCDKIEQSNAPIYLVMGNEGMGVRENIKQKGAQITIPISDSTESLNVAAAGAILLHLLQKGSC